MTAKKCFLFGALFVLIAGYRGVAPMRPPRPHLPDPSAFSSSLTQLKGKLVTLKKKIERLKLGRRPTVASVSSPAPLASQDNIRIGRPTVKEVEAVRRFLYYALLGEPGHTDDSKQIWKEINNDLPAELARLVFGLPEHVRDAVVGVRVARDVSQDNKIVGAIFCHYWVDFSHRYYQEHGSKPNALEEHVLKELIGERIKGLVFGIQLGTITQREGAESFLSADPLLKVNKGHVVVKTIAVAKDYRAAGIEEKLVAAIQEMYPSGVHTLSGEVEVGSLLERFYQRPRI